MNMDTASESVHDVMLELGQELANVCTIYDLRKRQQIAQLKANMLDWLCDYYVAVKRENKNEPAERSQ